MGDQKDKSLYTRCQEGLIAALFASPKDVVDCMGVIEKSDFDDPTLQEIYATILTLSNSGKPITAITVAGDLESRGLLKSVGGFLKVEEMSANWILLAGEGTVKVFTELVKEFSARKKVRDLISSNVALLDDDSGTSAVKTVEIIQSGLNDTLCRLSDNSTTFNLSDTGFYRKIMADRKEAFAKSQGAEMGLQGVPLSLPSLNRYTSGMLAGQLITVGARTGVGKSSFALNCATTAGLAGKSVLFFSLEMSETELYDKIYSSISNVPLNIIRKASLSPEEDQVYEDAIQQVKASKLQLDTNPNVTIDYIRAKAIKQAMSPNGLDLVIVDYLQLITPSGRFSSRQEAVADVSRNMKLLAKQLNVPVMVLVQVNRETRNKDGKTEEDNTPRLADIRESGAIAQDSDIVILIHRDSKANEDVLPKTLFILAKNRNGEAPKYVSCHSVLDRSKFIEEIKVGELNQSGEANNNNSETPTTPLSEEYDDGLGFVPPPPDTYPDTTDDITLEQEHMPSREPFKNPEYDSEIFEDSDLESW